MGEVDVPRAASPVHGGHGIHAATVGPSMRLGPVVHATGVGVVEVAGIISACSSTKTVHVIGKSGGHTHFLYGIGGGVISASGARARRVHGRCNSAGSASASVETAVDVVVASLRTTITAVHLVSTAPGAKFHSGPHARHATRGRSPVPGITWRWNAAHHAPVVPLLNPGVGWRASRMIVKGVHVIVPPSSVLHHRSLLYDSASCVHIRV